AIRAEIDKVADGTWALKDSPLRNAPHSAEALLTDKWTLPYTREEAAYPLPGVRAVKYWPPLGRIGGASRDRDLICSLPPPRAVRHRLGGRLHRDPSLSIGDHRSPTSVRGGEGGQVTEPIHRESPLFAEHERLDATFTDFAGWRMPLRYGSDLAEHRAVRSAA